MMVRHLGHNEMSDAIEGAVESALRAGECTRDLGGSLSTGEVGDAVARRLKD
jgi:isocitrate/isopropylmalate dehydrogenase